MCVVNKQFELLEFVFDSVYVDLQYDEISLTFLLDPCPCVVSSLVCHEVVMGPYVDAVFAVTVMCVLLFVLHVCMQRECECVSLTAMLVWGIVEVWMW